MPDVLRGQLRVVATAFRRWPATITAGTVGVHWCYAAVTDIVLGNPIEWSEGLGARVFPADSLTAEQIRQIAPEVQGIEAVSDPSFCVSFPSARAFFEGVNRLAVHPAVAGVDGPYCRVSERPASQVRARTTSVPTSAPRSKPSGALQATAVAVGGDEATICPTMNELVQRFPLVRPTWWTHIGDTAVFWVGLVPDARSSESYSEETLREVHEWLAEQPSVRATRFRDDRWPCVPNTYELDLQPGATVDDLRALDGTAGLPLASARYEEDAYGLIVRFSDRAMALFADPWETAAKLQSLWPVARADPVGIGFIDKPAR